MKSKLGQKAKVTPREWYNLFRISYTVSASCFMASDGVEHHYGIVDTVSRNSFLLVWQPFSQDLLRDFGFGSGWSPFFKTKLGQKNFRFENLQK